MVTMQISREWRSRVIKRGCLFCLMVGWLGWGALLGESPSSVRGESPAPESPREVEWSLQPPAILSPVDESHARKTRGSQGVAGIERSPQGRLWATWYAGTGTRGVESPFSYVVLATSGDDGQTWEERVVLQPRRFVRAMDPNLWLDPQGKLWFFWVQCAGLQDGRWGVWAMIAEDPEEAATTWSAPRRIANGLMLNKPTVLANGDWLLPVGLWRENEPTLALDRHDVSPYTHADLVHDLGDERGSNVIRSRDGGQTFEFLGQARVPGTRVDEHMLVERRDGSLWMLVRTVRGIGQSHSTDGGRTWSEGTVYLPGRKYSNKRFFLRRLQSGALLLVRNDHPEGQRSHMTAFVSDDEGETWSDGFLLDERESSYPDGTQAPNGDIYLIYDHQRYTRNRAGDEGIGSVQMAIFREEDIRAGKTVSPRTRLQQEISRLAP